MATQRKVKKIPKPPARKSSKEFDSSRSVRHFQLGSGLPSVTDMRAEIQDMTDVLLGRKPPPIDKGLFTLQEVADAYFSRASEMTMLIQDGEREGKIPKGSVYYKFRTGTLRTFLEMTKRAADLGSRRLTYMQLVYQEKRDTVLLGYDHDAED